MPDSTAVVVPVDSKGSLQPDQAAGVAPLKGGAIALAPMPLGGGKRRKTKKVPKKILKLFKKGSAKKLRKMMKGGEVQGVVASGEGEGDDETGAMGGRKRKTRRGSRKSRRHGFLY